MTFYVVYRASRNAKDRGTIPHELRSLGCTQIHKSLWEVEEEEVDKILRILHKNEPVILRKTREIRKPRWREENKVCDFGSLLVVAYKIPKEKRKTINRALWKMPCIPLCRAVYAFPQKNRLSDRENQLVTSFLKLIKENHGNAKVISRVVIEDQTSVKKLLDEIADRIQKEASDIIASCRALACKTAKEDCNTACFSKNLTDLKKRIAHLRKVIGFYKKWLRMNFSKNLLKTYRAIKRVQNVIEQKKGGTL